MNKQTPLFTWHRSHGAKITPFAGWDMPLQYHTGPIQEHHLVRRSAGVFDISHMGRIRFSGAAARDVLQSVLTANIASIEHGMSAYSLMCRDDGTIIDDVFVYRWHDEYVAVVNAANHDRDLAWFHGHAGNNELVIHDETRATAGIALQGPLAASLLELISTSDVSSLPRFGCAVIAVNDTEMLAGRTGYTGEDGFELFPPADTAETVWDRLFEVSAEQGVDFGPCGLAARDSLRFEAGFHLYGHELDDTTGPVEARLAWACALGTEFVGRNAIESQMNNGVPRRLCTFVMTDPAVPRQGYAVLDSEGNTIGTVTSGMRAPSVDVYAGNAFVSREFARTGTEIVIDVRGRRKVARVVKRPLYTPRYRV